MLYYKNSEVAKKYKVSKATVGHWVAAALKSGNNLGIVTVNGKQYIAQTEHNDNILQQLSHKGQKFKNKSVLRKISPQPEFYEIFNESQIVELLMNLEVYHEIPHKFSYFNGGAQYWDNYVKRTIREHISTTVSNTADVLRLNKTFIYNALGRKKVNFVDIGVGNAYPVKEILKFLHAKKALKKYIALDISESMLEIAQNNIVVWYNTKVDYEGHIVDISNENIRDLLFRNSQYSDSHDTINLVCFLGSTIENMEPNDHSLENIRKSLGINDIFVLGRTLDTDKAKTFFDFSETSPKEEPDNKWKWMYEALSLTEDLYRYEMLYDEKTKSRIGQMVLTSDVELEFKTKLFGKVISFKKGDAIVTWRHRHHRYREIVEEMISNGFEILQTSTSPDHSHLLVIAKAATQQ